MSKIGIDLVHIPTFSEKLKESALLKRLFTDQELENAEGSIETLAGMFAAKEAYFKAVRQTPDWHAVTIEHNDDGSPELRFHESALISDTGTHDDSPRRRYGVAGPRVSASVSISHDGEYAVATVMINDYYDYAP